MRDYTSVLGKKVMPRRHSLVTRQIIMSSMPLCDITDNCEDRVRWLTATVRDELTQKVDYRAVEAGALLGIAHGIVQCCNRINELMTGKKSCEYNSILDELSDIDEKIGTPLLNEDIKPDADKCVESLMMLVNDMKDSTIDVLGLKREGAAR